jgi:hypothetical protein
LIFYPAGNFTISGKVEEERRFKNMMVEQFGEYNRLASFYFKKDTENIMQIVEEDKDDIPY